MEYQVQINNLKAKLQETRARKKQEEKLIMEVENQALRVSFFLPINAKRLKGTNIYATSF